MAGRRDKGTGSVFEREITLPSGKKMTRYVGTVELQPRGGTRRRKTIYGTSRQDVKEQLHKLSMERDRLGDLNTADPTVEQYAKQWLTAVASRVQPGTLKGYRSKVDKWIIPVLGAKKINRLTRADVRDLQDTVMTAKRTPTSTKTLSPAQANGVVRVLSTMLTDAMKDDIVGRNVAERAAVRPRYKEGQSLTAEQAMAVIIAATDRRLGATWAVAFLLGLRQSERLAMRWSLTDLENGLVDVSWTLDRLPWKHGCGGKCDKDRRAPWCPRREVDVHPTVELIPVDGNLVLTRPKSDTSRRIVPIPDVLIPVLKARWEQTLAERPFYAADHDLVWCTPDGAPVAAREDYATYKTLLVKAGAPDVTLHDARHTCATLLAELGVDEQTRMRIHGHNSVAMARNYRHVSQEKTREAVNRLGTVLAIGPSSTAADV